MADITPEQSVEDVAKAKALNPEQKPQQHLGDGPDRFMGVYEEGHASVGLMDQTGNQLADTMKEQFPGLFDDVQFQQGPVKEIDRTAAKLLDKNGNFDQSKAAGVTDIVRGRIVIDTPEQIMAIRQILADENSRKEMGIVNVKDRFAVPSDTHYRDINLTVQLPNGHLAEIQINQRDMLAAADFTHDSYEDADAIAKRSNGQFQSGDDLEAKERLDNYSRDVHDYGAAKVPGLDDTLSPEGRAKLEKDYAIRREQNPDFKPGGTIQQGTKYDALLAADPATGEDFLRHSKINGGDGYKALAAENGIKPDKLQLDTSSLGEQTTRWDKRTNTLIIEDQEKFDDMLERQGMTMEQYEDSLSGRGGHISAPDVPHVRALSITEEFGRRAGVVVGVGAGLVVGGAALSNGASASEAAMATAEATVPFVSAGVALEEGRTTEAALRTIEEIPFGMVATEIARPAARALGADVDPSIGQMIIDKATSHAAASPEQQEFMRVFDALPTKSTPDMPPEVASLVEQKSMILQAEANFENTNSSDIPAHQAAQRTLENAENGYSAQYDTLISSGGKETVDEWINENPLPDDSMMTQPAMENAAPLIVASSQPAAQQYRR